MRRFDSKKMRVALVAYEVIWWILTPVALIYLLLRSRKDPQYKSNILERFGFISKAIEPGAIWIHAVSMGEVRSVVSLARELLKDGESVHFTVMTPAGHQDVSRAFGEEMANGTVTLSWVPIELAGAYRRFLKRLQPKSSLIMEIEMWPRMIAAARRAQVPIYMCNAQYPKKSFERDMSSLRIRADLCAGYTGIFAKSDLQCERFKAAGAVNVESTGELRFDNAIPTELLEAGERLRTWLKAEKRPVVTFASAIEGEDELYLSAMKTLLEESDKDGSPRPFFVYVPRAPDRFGDVAELLSQHELSFIARSSTLGKDLEPLGDAPSVDILLGDSMGEMFAYLNMADTVVVGGGYMPKGAHNISEPLALGKPAIVGPYIWTIEYPAIEAQQAGVLQVNAMGEEPLIASLRASRTSPASTEKVDAFFALHSGATARTFSAFKKTLER